MGPIRRVAISYGVYFTAIGASWAYLPIYFRDLGLSLTLIGLLTALSAGVQLVAAPGWGALADRFPASRISLPVAAGVAAVGAASLAASGASPLTAASVVVLAMGLGGIGPVLDARTLDFLGPDRQRFGQIRATGSIAFVLVTWLVGMLIDQRGASALFLVYVPALAATALVSLAIPRRGAGRRPALLPGLGAFLRTPGVALFLVGALLTWMTLNAVGGFYSIQVVALGGTAQLAGLTWVAAASIEIPVMWGYRRLAARFGSGRLLVLGASMFAARAAIAAAAPDATWLLAIAPLQGIGFGLFFVGSVAFVANRAPAGLAATAQGVLTAAMGTATILGTGLGGLLAGATSISWLFASAAAGGAAAAAIVALAARSATGGAERAHVQPASPPPGPQPLTREEVRS